MGIVKKEFIYDDRGKVLVAVTFPFDFSEGEKREFLKNLRRELIKRRKRKEKDKK